MTRPVIDTELIGELRRRVIEHNEAGGERVKLGELKKIYVANFSGEHPAAHAIAAVDRHLGLRQRQAGDEQSPPGHA